MSSASIAGVAATPFGRVSRAICPQGLFAVWLLVFYTAWTGVVIFSGLWPVVRAHWPISVAMAGGSFVGGSSPVAGGTVGFPVLVYVFGHPAKLGRTFSLSIQAIGMISASPYTKWIALFTVVAVALVAVYGRGLAQRLPVLIGGLAAYILYALTASSFGAPTIDFGKIGAAAWFGKVATAPGSRRR